MTGPGDPVERFAFVDAARGWAFLLVLLLHATLTVPDVPGWLYELGLKGEFGVQLFFVASAYTLLLSWHARSRADRRPVASFFVRRVARVAPLFWAAIPFYLWWQGTGPTPYPQDGVSAGDVLLTATFLHGWSPRAYNSVVPGGWSIAVEMGFYLLVPIAARTATTLRAAIAWLIGCWAVSLAATNLWGAGVLPPHGVEPGPMWRFVYSSLPHQLPVFAVGFVLYHLTPVPGRPTPNASAWPAVAVFALVVVLYRTPLVPEVLTAAVVFGLGLWGLALYPVRLLVNRVTRAIGVVSYSGYLTHFAVIGLLARAVGADADAPPGGLPADRLIPAPLIAPAADPLIRFAVVLVSGLIGTLIVSVVTYRLIELPGQKLGRIIIRRLNAGPCRLEVPPP